MKKVLSVLIPLTLCAAAAFGYDYDDSVVRWRSIVGVITTPGVDSPVSSIRAVNLNNGEASFEVEGLVINGTGSTGTPGAISAVTGTLVCNAGTTAQSILDTAAVAINVHGNAHFSGRIAGILATCGNPLFLVRIATPAGAAGRWIATGTERFIDDDGL